MKNLLNNSGLPSWVHHAGIAGGWLCLALAPTLGGCADHDREYRRERVQIVDETPPREVIVEQPVYEPPPREVVVVYDQELAPYGHWVDTRYGRCWIYDRRPYGWRPYTYGHWAYTDQGQVWVAEGDESAWGGTCYHYGRWYEDANYGWVWVPGRVWGPSWVAWREGDGYCGWAPLPPECNDGRELTVVEVDRYVPRDRYVYVEERYINEPHVHERFVHNDVTIINRTTNITNVTYVNNTVVNRGVSSDHVREHGGRVIQAESVHRVNNATEAHRLAAEGRPVLYTPAALESYVETHPLEPQNASIPRGENRPRPLPQHERDVRHERPAPISRPPSEIQPYRSPLDRRADIEEADRLKRADEQRLEREKIDGENRPHPRPQTKTRPRETDSDAGPEGRRGRDDPKHPNADGRNKPHRSDDPKDAH